MSEVEHQPSQRRFVVKTDEGVAFLSYEPNAATALDMQHTVVPAAARGRGIGESLVVAALDHARQAGLKVVPSCPFVRDWIAEHPESKDLLAAEPAT